MISFNPSFLLGFVIVDKGKPHGPCLRESHDLFLVQVRHRSKAGGNVGQLIVDVGRGLAVGGIPYMGMPLEVELLIQDGPLAAHEQQGQLVVQHPYLIRGQQLTATLSSDELKNAVKQKKDFRFTAFFILSEVIPYNAIAVSFQDYS